MRIAARHFRVATISCLLLIACMATPAVARATADVPETTCQRLTASLNADKTYHIFSVAVGGDQSAASSYEFNFGDGQSYKFPHGPSANGTARVQHKYDKPGSYAVTAYVLVQDGNAERRVSSSDCTFRVSAGDIPEVGPSHVLVPVVLGAVAGAGAHSLVLRRKIRRSLPTCH